MVGLYTLAAHFIAIDENWWNDTGFLN